MDKDKGHVIIIPSRWDSPVRLIREGQSQYTQENMTPRVGCYFGTPPPQQQVFIGCHQGPNILREFLRLISEIDDEQSGHHLPLLTFLSHNRLTFCFSICLK